MKLFLLNPTGGPSAAQDHEDLKRGTVQNPLSLLIIDEKPMLGLLQQLEQLGCQVFLAHQMPEALRVLNHRTIDLILLDLPEEGNAGLVLLQDLVERQTRPVMVMVSRWDRELGLRSLDLGAEDCLLKPLDPDLLLARMQAVLRRYRPASWPQLRAPGD